MKLQKKISIDNLISMNRIRKVNGIYQVLITPNIKIAPDSPILVGNWEDEYLRNYHVLSFDNLGDAQYEALKYPDIDWNRLIINHRHIFNRLDSLIRRLLDDFNYTVEIKSKLMTAEEFKNIMFARVIRGGERFNLRYSFNDIISFTIINPWVNTLHKISKLLENKRSHMYRDDLRIRHKKVVDDKIIVLNGSTEFGTTYEIKFIPTILYQWAEWKNKYGGNNITYDNNLYKKLLMTQNHIDQGAKVR